MDTLIDTLTRGVVEEWGMEALILISIIAALVYIVYLFAKLRYSKNEGQAAVSQRGQVNINNPGQQGPVVVTIGAQSAPALTPAQKLRLELEEQGLDADEVLALLQELKQRAPGWVHGDSALHAAFPRKFCARHNKTSGVGDSGCYETTYHLNGLSAIGERALRLLSQEAQD